MNELKSCLCGSNFAIYKTIESPGPAVTQLFFPNEPAQKANYGFHFLTGMNGTEEPDNPKKNRVNSIRQEVETCGVYPGTCVHL